MATRFLFTIVFLFFLGIKFPIKSSFKLIAQDDFHEAQGFIASPQNQLCIGISSTEKELYFNSSKWNCTINLSNKSIIPRFINSNMPIGVNQFSGNEEKIWLRIMKGDSVYINSKLTGRDALPKKRMLMKISDFKIIKKVDFGNLTYENSRKITDSREYTNEDYGEYSIQAIYIKNTDSIFSNTIKVQYLEGCN